MTDPKNEENSKKVPSVSSTVTKAIGILDILASKADVGISLVELSVLLNMPKSSTHRYLNTLLELGMAERKDGDRFFLGTKVIELAGSYLMKNDLHKESVVVMKELAELTSETIHLAIPSGIEVVYIAKIESTHALGMSSHIGSRLPMYSTSLGKAILAFNKPELLQSVISGGMQKRTSQTITAEETLRAELKKIRAQGFALDNEENEPGIKCVGAPVLDYSSTAIAAISISAPTERMSQDRVIEIGRLLWDHVQRISRRWGYLGQTTS